MFKRCDYFMSTGLLWLILVFSSPLVSGSVVDPIASDANMARPCAEDRDADAAGPMHYGYRVIGRHPHDPGAFTQGLVFVGDQLYESTGLTGMSSLREVDLGSGRVLRRLNLDDNVFAEGLAAVDKRLIQLTWRSGLIFTYDRATLQRLARIAYPGEAWGATLLDGRLLISDGSALLTLLDTDTFKIVSALTVRDGKRPVPGLNELEYVAGRILANVWPTDCIAEIDPTNGRVTGWIDLTGLHPHAARQDPAAVLNGIAYNTNHKRLYVTGKYWPYIYAIERVVRDEDRNE